MPNMYGKLAVASTLPKANPNCLVCGTAIATLSLDLATFTLQQLVAAVLKKRLAFVAPIVTLDAFMYEEGEDLDEEEREENAAHLPKALAALPGGGVQHNARVIVTDQLQDMTVTLVVQQAVRSAACGHARPSCRCAVVGEPSGSSSRRFWALVFFIRFLFGGSPTVCTLRFPRCIGFSRPIRDRKPACALQPRGGGLLFLMGARTEGGTLEYQLYPGRKYP